MVNKTLIMYQDDDPKFITTLRANTYEETIYAETLYKNEDGSVSEETVELAVHVNDMIKMRDFLNTVISRIGPAGEYTEDNIFIKLHEEK